MINTIQREPRAPIATTIFGMATVHPSCNPAPGYTHCVIFPGSRKTEWFGSGEDAWKVANDFNGVISDTESDFQVRR